MFCKMSIRFIHVLAVAFLFIAEYEYITMFKIHSSLLPILLQMNILDWFQVLLIINTVLQDFCEHKWKYIFDKIQDKKKT